jgi:hypothetical protein
MKFPSQFILEAFILQGKIKILFLCNYALKLRIRIMSVRDFPPEKVDKLIIYLFLFRDIDDIPKIFFHKNFFLKTLFAYFITT